MNPQDVVNMLDQQCMFVTKKPKSLTIMSMKVLTSIKMDSISNLDPLSCSFTYYQKPNEQTKAVVAILERQLSKFKCDENKMVIEPKSNSFKHNEIYNLIFPNLHHITFEYKIKSIFKKYENKLLEPMQESVYEKNIFNQKGYQKLLLIEPMKNQPKFESQEQFRESNNNHLSKTESNMLETLLKTLINKHSTQHSNLHNDLNALTIPILRQSFDSIEGSSTPNTDSRFLFAPVKGFERCLVKLKEQVSKDTKVKFPLGTLKDISRCSFVFEDANELVSFYEGMRRSINVSDKFELYEVKNMFSNTRLDKQSQKDIKLVMGYKPTNIVNITFEVQLILKDILNLKKTLHKFYDITRADFTPLRLEFLRQVTDRVGELAMKNKNPEYGPGNMCYEVLKSTKDIYDFMKDKIINGKFINMSDIATDKEFWQECEGNIFNKIGGYSDQNDEEEPDPGQVIEDSKNIEDAQFLSMCPFGTKDKDKMISVQQVEDGESCLLFFLQRAEKGESKLVYEQSGRKFLINIACIKMAKDDNKFCLEQQIFRELEDGTVEDVGGNEQVWKIEIEDGKIETTFKALKQCAEDDDFIFEDIDIDTFKEKEMDYNYIQEFDLQVSREHDNVDDVASVESDEQQEDEDEEIQNQQDQEQNEIDLVNDNTQIVEKDETDV